MGPGSESGARAGVLGAVGGLPADLSNRCESCPWANKVGPGWGSAQFHLGCLTFLLASGVLGYSVVERGSEQVERLRAWKRG